LIKKYASETGREEGETHFKLEGGYIMDKTNTIKEIKK